MKIKEGYKIRDIAGDKVVIMQGKLGADMTRVISLNPSAEWLWESLAGKDFLTDDAAALLVEKYGIDAGTALVDAAAWVDQMRGCGIIEE